MTGAKQNMLRLPRNVLERWTADVLAHKGLVRADAELAAEMLVRSDARGFKTHGLSRLKSYLEKLDSGDVTIGAAPEISVLGALIRYDAGGVLGQIAGPRAVAKAIEHAGTQPLVACQLVNVGHLGALSVNLLAASDAGMVALMVQPTPPVMGLPGAQAPLIGNNPLAMVAPRPNGPPVVVDMACCVAARGNILLAARDGSAIPEGWALDAQGMPTTDPDAALTGALLPFGGPKGLALAMIIEVLGGSLAGVPFRTDLDARSARQGGAGNLSALILVMNPDLMEGRAPYETHMAAWTEHAAGHGGPGARIPGERAQEAEMRCAELGVPLQTALLAELRAAGEAAACPFPAPPTERATTEHTQQGGP